MVVIIFSVVVILTVVTILFMRQPQFGKAPSGARLERIRQSPNYKDGAFQNLSFTPSLTEGYSFAGIFYDFLFKKIPDSAPKERLPSIHTDLHKLPDDALVWFGHSSYLIRTNGLNILVDPVFSGRASPVPGFTKAFNGADIYTAADMPEIDYLLITHDHYDHLDYRTVQKLKDKVKKVVCGLGVGAHLEHWGYPADKIIEKDWDETIQLAPDVQLHTLPARHFSGRGFKRNNTLWMSCLLETPAKKIFIGGDSGYDTHFARIGRQFGPIDLAILENGQYNVAWQAIHCLPEETLKAVQDLQARYLMPVHSGKFALGLHAWYEPLREITRLNQTYQIPLITPTIGEMVYLGDSAQAFSAWWDAAPNNTNSAGHIN